MKKDPVFQTATDAAVLVALGALAGDVRSNPHPEGRAFVLAPQADGGMKVEYLEQPPVPVRRRGTVVVNDAESFIHAVSRYLDKDKTVIYASLSPASFAAVLNDHGAKGGADPHGTGWRDHRVTFAPAHSKEYELWTQREKNPMTQEHFAFFIENNLPDFKDPEGAKMLELALNFRVKNNLAFRSAMKLQDGSIDLQYTEQVEGGAGRSGNSKVPETFTIEIPVWSGLEAKAYRFEARLRYRIESGALSIKYELVRAHKVVERAFKDVLDQIRKGVKDAPVLFGTPGDK